MTRPFRERDPLEQSRRRWERATRPRDLGHVLQRLEGGLGEALLSARIVELWPALVEPQIGGLTRIERFAAGTLTIVVRPGPWRMQLLPMEHELREQLNHALEAAQVRRIRFLEA